MIVSEHTGIPVESITLIQSDTDIVPAAAVLAVHGPCSSEDQL